MSKTSLTPQPLAAIDVGSNTIHLVVAIPRAEDDDDTLHILADELEFVRLGAGVGASGHIAPERAERGIATLKQLRQVAEQTGATIILCAATEVMRLAANGPEFLGRAQAEVGLEIPVISGQQEAAFTFWGATSGRRLAAAQPLAVADLGGGSLELVLGRGRQFTWRSSVALGSGRLQDRFLPTDPPTAEEFSALRQEVSAILTALPLPEPVEVAPLLIVCGGTATTLLGLAQHALGLTEGQKCLSHQEIGQAIALLSAASAEQITARYGIETPRARILGAGATVLQALMERLACQAMEVSQRGIREGMILAYARHGAHWLEVAERGEG